MKIKKETVIHEMHVLYHVLSLVIRCSPLVIFNSSQFTSTERDMVSDVFYL
jgi:hypothetical protein